MSRNQIVYRLLSNESGITNSKLRSGNLSNNEWNSISKSIASLSDLNIYLDDKSDITISDIRFKLNALQSRLGSIGLVVIDYLQLISDSHLKDSRVQELSRITRSLKLLAKDFNVPIIVLSQLSRNVESRTNKKPLLSDLRESGCFSLSTNLYTSFQRNKKVYPTQNLNKNDFQLLGLRQKKQSLSLSKSRVKSIFPTGFNFTYKLMIFGHHLVKLTNNHKVLTQHGWKKVEYLSTLDLISVLDKYNFIHFLRKGYHLNIFSFFTFIQISNIVPFCKEIVYDCWLPLTNSFLGNGYILHNSIEQDADLVLMLYREDYYSQDKKENNDLTHVIIAKHRNGPIGKINLIFDPITASFNNLIN
jgi:replicative DNA helicase